jgi:hypothetical protein
MSSTLLSKSRLALRATPMIRATMRQPIRQQPLSTMQKLRQAAVEHGFDGLVQTEKVAKSDWRVQQKRLWHSATLYVCLSTKEIKHRADL